MACRACFIHLKKEDSKMYEEIKVTGELSNIRLLLRNLHEASVPDEVSFSEITHTPSDSNSLGLDELATIVISFSTSLLATTTYDVAKSCVIRQIEKAKARGKISVDSNNKEDISMHDNE
jgi:hypothetical protein